MKILEKDRGRFSVHPNGERNAAYIATSSLWDAFTDGCFSCVSYFYNPLDTPCGMMINAAIDGAIDIAEPALYSAYENQDISGRKQGSSISERDMHRLTSMESRGHYEK